MDKNVNVLKQTICEIIIILCVIVPFSKTQVITSTLTDDQFQCPGQQVTFTCVTRGSQTIAWTSQEYIGPPGVRLLLASFDVIGSPIVSQINPDVVASLISMSLDNGVQVLESELRIVISSDFPSATISCVRRNGTQSDTTFQVLAEPSMPQNVASDQREDDKGRCIIHVSWNTLSSAVMEDVTHFNISINETAKIMEPYDRTRNLSLSAHMECSCGGHRVSMVAINRCGAMSRRTQNIVPDKKPMLTSLSECSASTIQSPGDNDSNKGNQTQSGSTRSCTEGYLYATIVLVIVVVILLVVITVLSICICCKDSSKQQVLRKWVKSHCPRNHRKITPKT